MATIAELLSQRSQLEMVSDSPLLDAELLLCHCLQKNRSYLRTWPQQQIAAAEKLCYRQLMSRRQEGEPVAYLIGERGFWSLDLAVSPATLIPRPETEQLVEKGLGLLAGQRQAQVLDLGTGTGAIALAMASERPQWVISGCDIEPAAVTLAESNRQKYALSNVRLFQSDWFAAVGQHSYDLIVSNPPYIDPQDPHLAQGDVRFEPRSALIAGNRGMADIETIIAAAPAYLNLKGWLLFEHGYDQGAAVRALLTTTGFDQVFTDQDLAGLDRVSGGRWLTGVSTDE